MNTVENLPEPFNKLIVEIRKGHHKDFGLAPDSKYPLRGVTYPVDYGYLPDYIGEDGDELDFFIGTDIEGKTGYFTVWRPDIAVEHKYYVGLTDKEQKEVLTAFEPVIRNHVELQNLDDLTNSIKEFHK